VADSDLKNGTIWDRARWITSTTQKDVSAPVEQVFDPARLVWPPSNGGFHGINPDYRRSRFAVRRRWILGSWSRLLVNERVSASGLNQGLATNERALASSAAAKHSFLVHNIGFIVLFSFRCGSCNGNY
jgi:hypothetical protein